MLVAVIDFDFSRCVLGFQVIAQPTEAQEFQSRELESLKIFFSEEIRICVATILQMSEEIQIP